MDKFRFEAAIEDISLPEVLGMLATNDVTGTLTVIFGNIVRKLFFIDGKIASASSSTKSDQLDQILIKLGKLDQKKDRNLIHALQVGGLKKANLLFEKDVLKPTDLVWVVKFQVVKIIYDLLQLTSGKLEFEFGETDDPAVMRLNISTSDLVIDAIKNFMTEDQLNELNDSESDVLVKTQAFAEKIDQLSLTPGESIIVRMIDGKKTIQEIYALSPFTKEVTRRLLMAIKLLRLCDKKQENAEGASDKQA